VIIKKLLLLILFFGVLLSPCLTSFAQKVFTDATEKTGLKDASMHGAAIVFGDYDNDGDFDLFISYGIWMVDNLGSCAFFSNNGDGTFTDITEKIGFKNDRGVYLHAGFLDYDNDGLIDFYTSYVENLWVKPKILIYHNNGNKTFNDISAKSGLELLGASFNGSFFDFDNDGYLDIFFALQFQNFLFKGKGNGTFVNVTDVSGLEGEIITVESALGDYDNDGNMDIFLSNTVGPSLLYHNNGDGTFSSVGKKAGVEEERGAGRCAAFFDYDNDGDLDIYTIAGVASSRLYRNDGNGTFTEVAQKAGAWLDSGERLTIGDYDNDGYIDMYVMGWMGERTLFHNNGDGTFTNLAIESGIKQGWAQFPGGCAFADYDNDGFLDLCSADNGKFTIYHNDGNQNHWLNIKLVGTKSNRDGIGARVKVKAGELSMMREINSGCAWANMVLTANFGLGRNSVAQNIEIRWLSGTITLLSDIPADQFIVVEEGKGITKGQAVNSHDKLPITWGGIKGNRLYQNYPNPSNPETWIPYQLENNADVEIKIYSSEGRLIRTLNLGRKQAGSYINQDNSAHWDGKDESDERVSSGVYFYVIKAGDFTASRKMIILR
jgi:hypothetical protein